MYRRCKVHQDVLYLDDFVLPEKTDHLHFSIISPLDSCGILSRACLRRIAISNESCELISSELSDARGVRINPRRRMC